MKSLSDRQGTSEYGAFDILHDQVVRPDIMQGANMGVIQGGYGVRFALEAFRELFVRNLDRDNAIQPCIASFVDFAHSTGAQKREDLIGPQPGCGCQRHWNPVIVPFWMRMAGGSGKPEPDRSLGLRGSYFRLAEPPELSRRFHVLPSQNNFCGFDTLSHKAAIR